MKDIMLDIETLGMDSNSLVVSISAVAFDLKSNKIGDKFEIGLKKDEQLEKGAVVDQDSLRWWDKQSDDAKAMLKMLDKHNIKFALETFNKWICDYSENSEKVNLWGNGASFDNVIINNLYKRHDIEFVVPYWCNRDVRTLVYLANIDPREYEFLGTKHHGISDCLHQIRYCQDAYNKLLIK